MRLAGLNENESIFVIMLVLIAISLWLWAVTHLIQSKRRNIFKVIILISFITPPAILAVPYYLMFRNVKPKDVNNTASRVFSDGSKAAATTAKIGSKSFISLGYWLFKKDV